MRKSRLKDASATAFDFVKFRVSGLPQTANYDVTGECNARCRHCYFFKNWCGQDIQEGHWKNIFESHKYLGIKSVTLTGGEPALKPDAIEYADKIFDTVLIVSNGIIKISENINRRIFVSIDGNKEIHEHIRNIGCFDKILENIKNDHRIVLHTTLSMLNKDKIDDVIKIVREQNICGITFSLYTANNCEDSMLLKGKDLDNTIKKLKDVLRENSDIVFLTDKMIDMFKSKEHIKNCYLKSKWVISFYPDLSIKSPCVMGEKIDCSTCGCIIPIIMCSLRKFDIKSIDTVKKLFPSHAYFDGNNKNWRRACVNV